MLSQARDRQIRGQLEKNKLKSLQISCHSLIEEQSRNLSGANEEVHEKNVYRALELHQSVQCLLSEMLYFKGLQFLIDPLNMN
jgi:hypothetical protein